jgi:hypothetical protein
MNETLDNLEEETIETPEEDNSEDNSHQKPETTEEKQEDPKEKRKLEQLNGTLKEVNRLETLAIKSQVALVKNDWQALLELHAEDPKLANKVAKEFGYSSFQEAKKQLEIDGVIKTQEEDRDTWYQKKRAQEIHEDSLKKADRFISNKKLDAELKDKAKAYFDKITDWKTLDEETAIEFADMATLYVSKDKIKSEKLDDAIKEMASWPTGWKKVSKSDDDEMIIWDWKLVPKSSLSNNQKS